MLAWVAVLALPGFAEAEDPLASVRATLAAQDTVLAALRAPGPAGVPIDLVRTPAALARAAALSEGDVIASGTVAAARGGRVVLLAPSGRVDPPLLDRAAHEYTHLAIARRTGDRAPIWLQEGIAGAYEARWRGERAPLTPTSLAMARHAAETGRLVPLAEMHPTLARLDRERAVVARTQVVLAVDALVGSAGEAGLAAVLDEVGRGVPAETAFARALRVAPADLERTLRSRILARPLPERAWHILHLLRARDTDRAPRTDAR